MASYNLLVFGLISLAVGALSEKSACNVPSRFWCDNPQIAADCNVLDQCHYFVKPDAKPVQFALYYESLCPGCRALITSQLAPAVKAVGSIMEVTMVPYGNARETYDGKHWVYECQHGKNECVGNLIETCAIAHLKNFTSYWPLISCIEQSPEAYRDANQAAKQCAKTLKMDLTDILKCAGSEEGNTLEHQMALKTNALNPPHVFVPWVVLNGKHTNQIQTEAQSNLIKLICDTYKGSPKPSACSAGPNLRSYR